MSDQQEVRIAELQQRMDRLERLVADRLGAAAPAPAPGTAVVPAAATPGPVDPVPAAGPVDLPPEQDPFFALTALKRALPAPGGVVYAGAVDLPGERHVDWQIGLATDTLLEESWAARSEAIAALAHPVRLEMLQEILLGMATVSALSALDGVGTSGQIYHHLRTLTAAGWLQSTSRGRYEVPTTRIIPLLALILAARS